MIGLNETSQDDATAYFCFGPDPFMHGFFWLLKIVQLFYNMHFFNSMCESDIYVLTQLINQHSLEYFYSTIHPRRPIKRQKSKLFLADNIVEDRKILANGICS